MSNILKHADQIINERSEEKERQYGPFMECNQKAAEIASVITGKPLTALDVSWVQVAVKMARESNAHKEDNLLDMVATIGAINNELEEPKPLKAPGVVPTYFSTISNQPFRRLRTSSGSVPSEYVRSNVFSQKRDAE